MPGPIVVGGVGGSGTRVIAELLQMLGVFMGNDLNESLDNLAFTLLFKRRAWFYRNHKNKQQLTRGLSILKKTMTSSGKFTFGEYMFLTKATLCMTISGHNREKAGNGRWPLVRAKKILRAQNLENASNTAWGWKEPNSHLILENIEAFFPGMKYIHCIRNGLDMAFSANQQQLYNWGPLFGVNPAATAINVDEAAFRYWVEANRRAIETGKKLDPAKFMLLNYDQLCDNPETGVKSIIEFLGLNTDEHLIERLIRLPARPSSARRYRNKNISWLSEEDAYFMKTLGFETT